MVIKLKKKHKQILFVVVVLSAILISVMVVQFSGFMIINGGGGIPEPEPEPTIPTNPSIVINNGDLITNSFEITLTLNCNDADEMKIRLTNDLYLNWESYTTTYVLILSESVLYNSEFRIGVIFKNVIGESVEVFDDITYEEPPQEEEEEDEDVNGDVETPYDYTLIYILLGVLGGLIGTGIYLKYRKKR